MIFAFLLGNVIFQAGQFLTGEKEPGGVRHIGSPTGPGTQTFLVGSMARGTGNKVSAGCESTPPQPPPRSGEGKQDNAPAVAVS
jgi:hypothetical protein